MDSGSFVFGSQYLRGMTPKREDWDSDMAAMRRLGFNTIRAWLVWGVLEPEEGRIDFEYLERFLDLASKRSLKAGLLFHLHGCPEWAVRKHKSYWYVDEEGRAFEPSARSNTPSGGWPGLCPDNPEVQELETRFIGAISSRFGEHPALAFWEPVNEPHQWIDFTKTPAACYCYCDASRAAFLRWLKAKYGSIDALGGAWGRRFSSWEDVRPPTWRVGFSDWSDWRGFTAENVASLVARRASLIRKGSSKPVIGHAWGGGCVTCSQLGSMSFDDWRNAEPLDQWGYSAFPDSVDGTCLVGLGTDATRVASRGKVFWQSELGSGDYGCGFDRDGRLRPEILSMWSWESLRHGVKGLLYWQYRKETQGWESGCYGLTDYSGGPTASTEAVAKIGRVLSENASLFNSSQPLPSQVAILFSFRTYVFEWSQKRNCQLSVDSVSGYYRMLWEESLPVDIVHEDFVDASALSRYKLVIAPMPLCLSETARQALKTFVADGGTLLSDPYFCSYDESLTLSPKVPGSGFHELFGCEEDDVTQVYGPIMLRRGSVEGSIDKGRFQEFFKLLPGAEPFAVYGDGRPAIVSNRHGKGRGLLSGLNLGLAYSQGLGLGDDLKREGGGGSCAFAKRLVLDVLAEASVEAPLKTSDGIVGSVLRGPEGEDVLIAINVKDAATEASLELKEGSYSSSAALDGGLAPSLEGNVLRVHFKPLESRAVLLSRKA